MSYMPFGRRQVKATIDGGFNPFNNSGNPTAKFTAQDLVLPQGQFEVYKASISGGGSGIAFTVFKDTYQVDSGTLDLIGNAAFYKASDAEFIITNQSELYFYFAAGSLSLPIVTLWVSFDPLLPINRGVFSSEGATQ